VTVPDAARGAVERNAYAAAFLNPANCSRISVSQMALPDLADFDWSFNRRVTWRDTNCDGPL
jgi:hypothetical protein